MPWFKTFYSKQKTQEAQKKEKPVFQRTEAVARRCSVKRIFLGVSQDSRESACAWFSLRKRLRRGCFPVDLAKFLRTTFLFFDISPLDTKYFNPNEIHEGFKCLCKNSFSILHVNIRSINKSFETFKNFYSKLNCTFSVIYFSRNLGYW